MNTQTTTPENKKTDWNDLKVKIKAHFGKLTDDNIESAKGNLDLLAASLVTTYGYAKEHAEKELAGFKSTLNKHDEKPSIKVVSQEPLAEKTAAPLASKVG